MLKGHLGFKGESSTIDISEKVDGVQTLTVTDYRGTQTTTIQDGELTSDQVIDNLTSEYTDKPLSAKQGKVLKTTIDTNDSKVGDLSNLTTTAKTNVVSAINEVDTDVETIKNSSGTGLIVVDNLTDEITTIAANSAYQITITTSKTGYIPLGVIGIATSSQSVGITSWRNYSTSTICTFRNYSNSALSNITLYIKVLYVKTNW